MRPTTTDRWKRLTVAVLALAFFASPAALRIVGVSAKAFENRRIAPAPRLDDGWAFFEETTRFLSDRMPLRYEAVRANTWLDLRLFDFTPQYGATQVALGRAGWYFLQEALDRACAPSTPFSRALDEWEALLDVIRSSGRQAVLVVAPDKSTIYPEYLAGSTRNRACAAENTAALWRLIENPAARASGVIGLRQPLLEAKRKSPELLYFRTDSHWNSKGALELVRAALSALDPALRVRPGDIHHSTALPFRGDLPGLIGGSVTEAAASVQIVRAPGAPVITARSVLVGDSYALWAMPNISAYIPRLTRFNWDRDATARIIGAIRDARAVILETVERNFAARAGSVGSVSPEFVSELRRALLPDAQSRPHPP
jgi:hypothetical protein